MVARRIAIAILGSVALGFAVVPRFLSAAGDAAGNGSVASEAGIEVVFSPSGGCTEVLVKEIGNARKSLDVQAYSFTSAPIAKAVADAHARGVAVQVVLDKS